MHESPRSDLIRQFLFYLIVTIAPADAVILIHLLKSR